MATGLMEWWIFKSSAICSKLMVWGCISESGVGELVKIDGSMNPEISLILICHAIPSRKPLTCFFFQHDHDHSLSWIDLPRVWISVLLKQNGSLLTESKNIKNEGCTLYMSQTVGTSGHYNIWHWYNWLISGKGNPDISNMYAIWVDL